MEYVVFCDWFLCSNSVFKIYQCCVVYLYFISFFSPKSFSIEWIFQILFIHSANDEHLCTNICVYIRLQIFFDTYLGVEFLGHMVTLCLNFLGTTKLFFYRFYTGLYSHQQSMKVLGFLHLLQPLLYCLFHFCHPNGCEEVVSHGGFGFHFPNNE